MKKKQRLLIVEDNDDMRNTLSEFLLRKGFQIGIAENGVEALKIFNDKDFDLVLTDFQMPYMDGLMLACEIKKKKPKTLVIMMSGDTQMGGRTKEVADYFVAKPFGINEMQNLINRAFEAKAQKRSPQINRSQQT
jgi:DNA-binding NtrC family response regulator